MSARLFDVDSTPGTKPAIGQVVPCTTRRRLAPNVVCMFAEDRLPVINIRRRGHNPRNVISIWTRPRLKPGDLAELCNAFCASNNGKKVRITGRFFADYLPKGDWWTVESVSGPLELAELGSDKPVGLSTTCISLGKQLRRVSNRLFVAEGGAA